MGMFSKKCAACREVLSLSAFEAVGNGKRASICKACQEKGAFQAVDGWWPVMPEILKPQYWRRA